MTGGYVEKSFAPAPADLEAIGAFTRRAFAPEELYVFSVVLCNNDVDRDHEKFTRRALEELGALFVGKTGIFDHSMKSGDQAARIYATAVVPVPGRKTADGEDLVTLQAKAYMVRTPGNAELITQIDGGIKKEVSVSCAMGSAVCSLCGADRRSGGCSHVPGRSYDGKVAFTVLSDATDAYEWSFVAVPAQREAGVVKHYDSRKGDKTVTENDVRKTLQNSKGAVTLTCDQARALARQLDTLEQEAQLGKSYKQELASQVVRLCAGVLPQMELGVFEGVARVMTAKELQAFKAAFEAADRRANMPSPQLASGGEKKSNNQAFVI